MAINYPDSPTNGQQFSQSGTTWQYDATAGVWNVLTSGGAGQASSFGVIAVATQDKVVADNPTGTLTLVTGSNVTLTTDATTDTVTISSVGAGGGEANQNAFSTIAVSGQTDVTADSATDTLTLAAGSGIQITTTPGTDTVTITNTQSGGAANFSTLQDAGNASLTIDKVYLPAITMLSVSVNGTVAYRFDQYGAANDNPTVYCISGTTIAFDLSGISASHPFQIQTAAGSNYNEGLYHVLDNGTVTTGASANAAYGGVLYWKVPESISGGYRYQCSSHAAMVGSITVKSFQTL